MDKPGDDVLAVYRLTEDGFENVTQKAKAGKPLPEGRYLVASIRLAPSGGWFGGKYYVDLLHPGVTEKFIEITMGAYRRELGDHFGKRLPGWFTDEPHLAPAGGLHWSDRLPRDFEKRWGYDLMDHLPSLVRPLGDWKRVRHNYYQFLLEQFIECWAKPCYEYCEKHNLEFTGHYWEHGWPGAGHGGDNMAMYAWHQRPAIDTLMNDYNEGVHAQFGNVRAVKELSSVANQLGRKRTLCEAYGAGGWDLRFEDMKRIGDWLYVLGVNTLDEHLSYVTIRGARKRDHPQSFSYHEPWWEAYHVMAEYFTRLSLVMSSGEEINPVLVIEPTTTAWMYQGHGRLNEIGNSFQKLVTDLSKAQAEYDIGCEDIIARQGAVVARQFRVGRRGYDLVILPPQTENLNSKTIELLEAYVGLGGRVLCCGQPPSHVDGAPSDRGRKLAKRPSWEQVHVPTAINRAKSRSQRGLAFRRREGDRGILLHQRRRLNDGELVLLVNTSIDSPTAGTIATAALGIEQWDLQSGHVRPYRFLDVDADSAAKDRPTVRTAPFQLPPCGSLVLFLSNDARKAAALAQEETSTIRPVAAPTARRVGPNVLTLDYVDVTAGGETKKNVYFYAANRFAFRKNGMYGNPWDSAVQLRDRLITKEFPPESGFEATYRFTIEDRAPDPLHIVVERPDLYTITCNGKPITAEKGAWWLDKAFGKLNVTKAAKVGENAVTIKASPFTMFHELEPAYVLGDFWLRPADSGFTILPPRRLGLGPRGAHVTVPDGTMWLSTGIGFRNTSESKTDGDPFIIFDLGKPYDLAAIKVWNYNEVNLTARGVNELKISGSTSGKPGTFTIPIGTFKLDQAVSGSTGPTGNPH
ncbi:MAG: glycosyl hydrolase, partial [Planctomycetota bacterium]